MSTTIHPYKGYLNTPFNIYVKGSDEVTFKIVKEGEDKETKQGKLKPKVPFSLKFEKPGNYNINFSDGTDPITLQVIDGYKFGGSSFKNAFIFDECPWVFVVMHDRTYFYNKLSEVGYVEPISPDYIKEISEDYVLFENKGQEEKTLYSLTKQKPVLYLTGKVHFYKEFVIAIQYNQTDKILSIFSLKNNYKLAEEKIMDYSIKENKVFIIDIDNKLKEITLDGDLEIQDILQKHGGTPLFFIEQILIACYDHKYKTLFIYNTEQENLIFSTRINGNLTSINGKRLIDIHERIKAIDNFNLKESSIYDSMIVAEYESYIFYPTSWEVFYTKKSEILKKDQRDNKSKYSIKVELKSCSDLKLNIDLKSEFNRSIITEALICLSNYKESFVRGASYSGSGYSDEGIVYSHKNLIILKKDKEIKYLSKNGYWDKKLEDEFEMSHFARYGVVYQKSTATYRSLRYNIKGKEIREDHFPIDSLVIGEDRILEGGEIWNDKWILNKVSYREAAISPNLKELLYFSNGSWYIKELANDIEQERKILSNIFDDSKYLNVLLSEDGNQILYRNNDLTEVFDYKNNEIISFENLHYIQQTNGIRPLFSRSSSLQPVLVNPQTGQKLSANEMTKYKFISCDNKFYADTQLKDYIEYHNEIRHENITQEEYKKLKHKFLVSPLENNRKERLKDVNELKKQFILSNFDYFHTTYPNLIKDDITGEHWDKKIYDENPSFFINLFITEEGVALIRKTENDEVITKIYLNCILEFINYVAFSMDNRYVAIASYMGHGLFILYDLLEDRKVIEEMPNRAVWNVAFSKAGLLAGYTSDPFTFFVNIENLDNLKKIEETKIVDRNFLTFSPDGQYMALSEQGYVSKYDQFGNERDVWGHRPSSMVEIRKSKNIDKNLIQFNDLSEFNRSNDPKESGIEDTWKRHAVASVSFSNDNKKLMMVGKDGVVIIRNLHLEEDANE